MNHDYTHCFDQTDDCPKDCFRVQLNDDLKLSDMFCRSLSWSHLKGTAECPRKESNEDG